MAKLDSTTIYGDLTTTGNFIIPIVCGTTCVTSPIVCATTTAVAPDISTTWICAYNGDVMGIGAGETGACLKANAGAGETLWLGAESGLKIVSSPDNWASLWAGRNEATLVDTAGKSTFPNCVTGTIFCGTNCMRAPTVCGSTSVSSPYICADGIRLENSTGRAGLLQVNRLGSCAYAGIDIDFSATANWALMGHETLAGLYDDTCKEWAFLYARNAGISLYNNCLVKLCTNSTGAAVCGTLCTITTGKGICDTSGYLCMGGASGFYLYGGATNIQMYASSTTSYMRYSNATKVNTLTNGACITGCGFATDFVASSDCRLKRCVEPITSALSTVSALCGVCYQLCADESGVNRIGLIAQDVEKVLPEVVTHSIPNNDKESLEEPSKFDEELGITYDKLTAVLIEAVKELKTQNECLQFQINELRKK